MEINTERLSPFWHHMGICIKEVEPGRAKTVMRARDEMIQMNKVLHGGAIASIIDTTIGTAVWTLCSKGTKIATVEMKVNYIASVPPGEEIEAEAKVIHDGSSLAVGTAEVKNSAGKLVAYGMATFILLRKEGPEGVRPIDSNFK